MEETLKLIAGMNKQNPGWWKDFASHKDLVELVEGRLTEDKVKIRTINAHTIFIRGAIEAGVVVLP